MINIVINIKIEAEKEKMTKKEIEIIIIIIDIKAIEINQGLDRDQDLKNITKARIIKAIIQNQDPDRIIKFIVIIKVEIAQTKMKKKII